MRLTAVATQKYTHTHKKSLHTKKPTNVHINQILHKKAGCVYDQFSMIAASFGQHLATRKFAEVDKLWPRRNEKF